MSDLKYAKQLLTLLTPGRSMEIKPYLGGLPLWLKESANYYLISSGGEVIAGLIMPKSDLGYEILVKIQGQMSSRERVSFLLITDELSARYHASFVRNQIPFIYKNEQIFAPTLGLKLSSRGWKKFNRKNDFPVNPPVNPFELKLLAGFLTDQLSLSSFNLDDLLRELKKNEYQCSKNKLSQTGRSLVARNLLIEKGSGPERKLEFISKEEIWEYLIDHKIKPASRLVQVSCDRPEAEYVYAGELALAQFSDLATPAKHHYAVTNRQYLNTKSRKESGGDPESSYFYLEIRKEDPKLFSLNNCINPIELFFELKDHSDERIQISLQQMLRMFKLKVSEHE